MSEDSKTEDKKIVVSESELEELVERKVEERLSTMDISPNSNEDKDNEKVSRRKFMKMMGLGAGGLALSGTASANFLSLDNYIGSSGDGEIQDLASVLTEGNTANLDINMDSNKVTGLAKPTDANDAVRQQDIEGEFLNRDNPTLSSGDIDLNGGDIVGGDRVKPDGNWLSIDGGGSGISFNDADETTRMRVDEGGPVSLPTTNLDMTSNQINFSNIENGDRFITGDNENAFIIQWSDPVIRIGQSGNGFNWRVNPGTGDVEQSGDLEVQGNEIHYNYDTGGNKRHLVVDHPESSFNSEYGSRTSLVGNEFTTIYGTSSGSSGNLFLIAGNPPGHDRFADLVLAVPQETVVINQAGETKSDREYNFDPGPNLLEMRVTSLGSGEDFRAHTTAISMSVP